jgi:hypothetical protein
MGSLGKGLASANAQKNLLKPESLLSLNPATKTPLSIMNFFRGSK